MADIELVIKIPEETYKNIKWYDWKNDGRWFSEEWRAICNGIPLPKGHGRLIDVNELDVTTITTNDYSGNEVLDVVLKEDIDEALTIIEADKAESEE